MATLIIVAPLPLVATAGSDGFARAVTPDPKEAVFCAANAQVSVTVDATRDVLVDSFFLGYHRGNADSSWAVQVLDANGNVTSTPVNTSAAALGLGPPYHSFARLGAVIQARYFRFVFNAGATASYFGVVAMGRAFQPTWGQEWGAGRMIDDTGTAERLFGGGFGIDDGVAAGGYAWTLGDLQPAELRQLYQLAKDRRTTRSVLVVEDPDQTDGLNERIHWGLFRKLDQYERLDPLNTKWSLQIGDWA